MKLIQRFEAAVRADEFKGAQPPEMFPAIEKELELARKLLEDKLKKANEILARSH